MNTMNCCTVDALKMQWFLYFLLYVQSAHPVPRTNVQVSSMILNTLPTVTYTVQYSTQGSPKFHVVSLNI